MADEGSTRAEDILSLHHGFLLYGPQHFEQIERKSRIRECMNRILSELKVTSAAGDILENWPLRVLIIQQGGYQGGYKTIYRRGKDGDQRCYRLDKSGDDW